MVLMKVKEWRLSRMALMKPSKLLILMRERRLLMTRGGLLMSNEPPMMRGEELMAVED